MSDIQMELSFTQFHPILPHYVPSPDHPKQLLSHFGIYSPQIFEDGYPIPHGGQFKLNTFRCFHLSLQLGLTSCQPSLLLFSEPPPICTNVCRNLKCSVTNSLYCEGMSLHMQPQILYSQSRPRTVEHIITF